MITDIVLVREPAYSTKLEDVCTKQTYDTLEFIGVIKDMFMLRTPNQDSLHSLKGGRLKVRKCKLFSNVELEVDQQDFHARH
ncbi:MAG TPA: hypothetical protein EYP08_02220 [Pyrodictiaceae archaeon]|nr:hypothetical protein [Pyrodictiaceae archaeon]HIQ10973.1 hypothetical protein [Pyrodictium sp.]